MEINYPKNSQELKVYALASVLQKVSIVSKNNIAEVLENSTKIYEFLGGDLYVGSESDISKIVDFFPLIMSAVNQPFNETEPPKKKTTKTA